MFGKPTRLHYLIARAIANPALGLWSVSRLTISTEASSKKGVGEAPVDSRGVAQPYFSGSTDDSFGSRMSDFVIGPLAKSVATFNRIEGVTLKLV
jgi:hypothetical protein